MSDDPRIIELLTDMLQEQRNLHKEQKITNLRLDKLEKQQAKTNIAINDLQLSVMQLAEKLEIVFQHEKRINRLEDAVFHD